MHLESLYTVLITPFDSEGKLDKEGLRSNLRFQLKHGIKGFVVLGTTGEAPTLSHQEKIAVIEIAAEELKGKGAYMLGLGAIRQSKRLPQLAKPNNWGRMGP